MLHPEGVRQNGDALCATRVLLRFLPDAALLLTELRCELGSKVFLLENLPDLEHGFRAGRIGTPLRPFDGLVHGPALPQPETGDELLRFGERSVDDRAFAAG